MKHGNDELVFILLFVSYGLNNYWYPSSNNVSPKCECPKIFLENSPYFLPGVLYGTSF